MELKKSIWAKGPEVPKVTKVPGLDFENMITIWEKVPEVPKVPKVPRVVLTIQKSLIAKVPEVFKGSWFIFWKIKKSIRAKEVTKVPKVPI